MDARKRSFKGFHFAKRVRTNCCVPQLVAPLKPRVVSSAIVKGAVAAQSLKRLSPLDR
jgi:hypothetical protein